MFAPPEVALGLFVLVVICVGAIYALDKLEDRRHARRVAADLVSDARRTQLDAAVRAPADVSAVPDLRTRIARLDNRRGPFGVPRAGGAPRDETLRVDSVRAERAQRLKEMQR
jgi:hypothetical protein